MPTDIKLDQNGGNWLVADAAVLKTTASDLMLDAPGRRIGGGPHRRALVHDQADGLTLNFNGDYPGGITAAGAVKVTGRLTAGAGLEVTGGLVVDGHPVTRSLEGQLDQAEQRIASLERIVEALLSIQQLVVVPGWRTLDEIRNGDDMGVLYQSAEALGLTVEYEYDQANPNFGHEDVISIVPDPGSVVPRGTTVHVRMNLQG
jgi:hypothetical protein